MKKIGSFYIIFLLVILIPVVVAEKEVKLEEASCVASHYLSERFKFTYNYIEVANPNISLVAYSEKDNKYLFHFHIEADIGTTIKQKEVLLVVNKQGIVENVLLANNKNNIQENQVL